MKEQGFTLVEILVAMVVLSIGLLSLAIMPITVTQVNSRVMHITESAYQAMDQLEAMVQKNFSDDDLAIGHHGPIDLQKGKANFQLSWQVTQKDARTKQVDVLLSWVENGVNKESTFRYQKIDFS